MPSILDTNEAFYSRDEKLFVRVVEQQPPPRLTLMQALGRIAAICFLIGFVTTLVSIWATP